MRRAHHAYYTSMIGDWSGGFSFALLAGAPIEVDGLFDRLSVRAMATLPLRLSTTVRATEVEDVFLHTTRISCLGWPVYLASERLELGPNGRAATLVSEARRWPWIWLVEHTSGSVVVEEDVSGATYRLDLFGAPLVQRTEVVAPGRLRLTQETSFSVATCLLERR